MPLVRKLVFFIVLIVVSSCGSSDGKIQRSVVTANAGPDIEVIEAATVQLSGSGSDSEGSHLTFQWSQVSGPTVSLSSPGSPNPTFEAPVASVSEPADIVLRLAVSNDQNTHAQDEVTVTIRASDFLVFRAAKESLNSFELYKYDVALDATTKLSGPMTAGGNVIEFSISPDGRYVAYLADQDTDGSIELYVAPSDGGSWRKISGASTTIDLNRGIRWAPDGASLLFLTKLALYVVDADGSRLYEVSEPFGPSGGFFFDGRWSSDSRYIAYVGRYTAEPIADSEYRLYLHDMTAPGGADQDVLVYSGDSSGLNFVRWSPDSSRLAFQVAPSGTVGHILFVSKLDGAAPLSLSDFAWWYEWSPDSEQVVFEEDLDRDFIGEVIVASRDGSYRTQLNSNQEARGMLGILRWSPDSSRVAFMVRDDNTSPYRLFTARRDGTLATRISYRNVSTSDVRFFVWSTDGSRIAVGERMDISGANSAIVATADGSVVYEASEPPSDAVGVDFGYAKNVWSPDGSYLAWRSAIDSSGTLGLYVANVNSLETKLVTPLPSQVAGQMQSYGHWSSDSSALAYTSQQDSATRTELYISSLDGSMNILASGSMTDQGMVADDFSWSP